MRGGFALLVFVAGLASIGCSPLSARVNEPLGRCELVGGEKLAIASGRGGAICAEVERAIAVVAPGVSYSAKIKLLSRSRLAATLVVNGRTLPGQNFALMDGNLSEGSIKHFARALAVAIKEASKS